MIGRTSDEVGEVVVVDSRQQAGSGSYDLHFGRMQNRTHEEEIAGVVVLPHNWNRKAVIWPHRDGKSALFDESGDPIAAVRKLVDAGYAVSTADLVGQGEFTPDGKSLSQTRTVENPREFAGYTLGYNHPLFAQRVHDILTLVEFARKHGSEEIVLVGLDEAAAWCAAACAQSNGTIDRLALAPGDFRFARITEIRDPNLLPGAVKYGDLPGLLALCAPTPMKLVGEGEKGPELVRMAYAAERSTKALQTDDGEASPEVITEWVLGKE